MRPKVLVTGSTVDARLLTPLTDAGFTVINPTHVLTESELITELKDSVGYLLGGDEYASEAALSAAPRLKVVAFAGMGYESFVDADAAARLGILVTNTPGALTDSVAEFTVGHLLNLRRRIGQYASRYRRGERGFEEKQADLAGHRFGILGLGGIGTRIAEQLRLGFGAKVTYYSRTRKPDEEERLGIQYAELTGLMPAVEGLIVMVPGNDETRSLLNTDLLALARPGMLLVNTARCEIVDPAALRTALDTGRVGTAAFDGFYEGPVGEALLHDFDESQLVVTGHIASLTHDARDAMARKAVRSILNIVATGKDPYVVNGRGTT